MRILIVDDETHALEALAQCVRELQPDAQVVTFARSDEALAAARAGEAYDVAFLDIHMPVVGGIELAKQLKQLYPNVNVIFCTAYSEHMVEAIRLHASGYVTKPYTKADIAREIDNLLHPVAMQKPRIFVRTFGNFDVFVDDVAVTFKRAKSKELLAFLVYKKGGMVSKKEIAAALFDDSYTPQKQNYVAKLYSDLGKDLRDAGIQSILCKGFNQYGVDVRLFGCDFYDYEEGHAYAINAYHGDFMSQYEWAEM